MGSVHDQQQEANTPETGEGSSGIASDYFQHLMTLPSFVYIAVLIGAPALYLVYLSMTEHFFSVIRETEFVGVSNYVAVLSSPEFWMYVGNTVFYAVAVVGGGIVLQIGIALALNTDLPYKRVWQTLIILPWAIPFVVSTLLWKLMFNPQFGLINYILMELGLIAGPIGWFGGKWIAFFTVIMTTIWINTPLAVLILLSGLNTIPDRLYEASVIDGAGPWHRFRHVTLPMLRPALMSVLLIESLLALRGFEIIFTMTKGGPGNATTVIAIDIYRELIRYGNVAYAAAESVILITMILGLLYLIVKYFSADYETEV